MGTRMPQRDPTMSHSRARPLPAPNTHTAPSILQGLLPSAPASPPTPAPSPTPQQRTPVWEDAVDDGDTFLRETRARFSRLASPERQRFLAELLDLCDSQQLSFVRAFVSPRLKRDPFIYLPNELCLRVWTPFVDLSLCTFSKYLLPRFRQYSSISSRLMGGFFFKLLWRHPTGPVIYR
jgi:hypothetical protein